jgi:hypothetical protein
MLTILRGLPPIHSARGTIGHRNAGETVQLILPADPGPNDPTHRTGLSLVTSLVELGLGQNKALSSENLIMILVGCWFMSQK